MKKLKKVCGDNRPVSVYRDETGCYLFRWDIVEVENKESGKIVYEYYEVAVYGEWIRENVMMAVINAMWSKDDEAKIINDYTAAKEGILDESYIEKFRLFATERAALKEMVNESFK